jgi:hypothetical protein
VSIGLQNDLLWFESKLIFLAALELWEPWGDENANVLEIL